MFGFNNANKTKAWKKLEGEYKRIKKTEMRELFAKDAKRAEKYTIQLNDLILDYSKNRFDDKVLDSLFALAKERRLSEKITEMFSGEKINNTENRSVLHIALRNRSNRKILSDGQDVMPQINEVLAKMKKFSDAVRFGEFKGYTGKTPQEYRADTNK